MGAGSFKSVIVFSLVSLFYSALCAQQVQLCGTDEMSREFYQAHPHLQEDMLGKREELKQHTEKYIRQVSSARGNDSLLIVPVVFHVIHNYGNENISDAQILSGLQVLNRNFKKQHPDMGNVEPLYQPIAADCEIEFRLARKDPNGNCTNGINRIASPLTNIGDHSVKSLIHWDPSKYLNIYVVKQIPNLAGHCLMPDQAAVKPEWDGIVISHQYLGNIGTSNELRSVVLAHEAGHFLNLFHIWGGNNVPGYYYLPVGQPGNCNIGDDVADTPPTIGWSTCSPLNASCGNPVDNYQNVMDYSYCNIMFTQGQKQRMRACLRSGVANRNNLIALSNLYTTGVVNSDTFCEARAAASKMYACIGDTIQFFDKSITQPDAWEWDFGDGNFSYEQNPKHAFFTDGLLNVVLKATKNGITKQSPPLSIKVADLVHDNYFVQDFESLNHFDNSGLIVGQENTLVQWTIANVGFNSARSAALLFADTLKYSGRNSLLSPALDLTKTPNATLSFNYYFSQKKLNNDDVLEVYFSNDCGRTWSSRLKRSGANFRTVVNPLQSFNDYDSDTSRWKTISLPIPANFRTQDFWFRIDFTNFYGNNFLIDNININPELFSSISNAEEVSISVTPNPALQKLNVQHPFEKIHLHIRDLTGRGLLIIENFESGEIDISQFSAGCYIVVLINRGRMFAKRFNKF
jgi:PKD repeat protein